MSSHVWDNSMSVQSKQRRCVLPEVSFQRTLRKWVLYRTIYGKNYSSLSGLSLLTFTCASWGEGNRRLGGKEYGMGRRGGGSLKKIPSPNLPVPAPEPDGPNHTTGSSKPSSPPRLARYTQKRTNILCWEGGFFLERIRITSEKRREGRQKKRKTRG